MMKIRQTLLALTASLFIVGSAAANHGGVGPVILTEGEATILGTSSICKSEDAVVSVIEEYRNNGFQASLKAYIVYTQLGECMSFRTPVMVTPVRLVDSFDDAVAVEVQNRDGIVGYLLAKGAKFIAAGDPA